MGMEWFGVDFPSITAAISSTCGKKQISPMTRRANWQPNKKKCYKKTRRRSDENPLVEVGVGWYVFSTNKQ